MAVFVLQLSVLSFLCVPIMMQFIFMTLSVSMSGIPNKAFPFPGTTKSLHIFCILLFSNLALHMPSCVIVTLLHVFTLMFLFLVAANCSIVALGNSFLDKCKGIILQSLSVSTLLDIIPLTWFDNVYKFAVNADHFLLKVSEFIFTLSM